MQRLGLFFEAWALTDQMSDSACSHDNLQSHQMAAMS